MSNILNKITWRGWVAAGLVFVTGSVLPACIGQIIDADPPQGAEARNIQSNLKLDESVRARNAYVRQENAFIESWDASIQDAEDKAAQWTGIFTNLTSPEMLAAYGLNPASGLVTMGLFGAGLFFRRPGDVPKEELAKEKEFSYNAGLDKTNSAAITQAYANGRLDLENEIKQKEVQNG